jgi:CO/xanthine dehydrogenase FAD-binding subunit
VRSAGAESFAASALPWESGAPLEPEVAEEFGARVAAAAAPIDDVRGTQAYRRRALAVLARRTLGWAWAELVGPGPAGPGLVGGGA